MPDNRFAETLRDEIGPWLAAGEDRVLLSGMIGSRQGWKEAPYLALPGRRRRRLPPLWCRSSSTGPR